MNKRGMSHIEMIASFLIFVGFLLFLLAFLNPIKESPINENLLDLAERGIIERGSVEIFKAQMYLKQPYSGCFGYDLDVSSVVVFNEKGNILQADYSGGYLYIDATSGELFTIHSFMDLEENTFSPGSCSIFDEENVTLGLSKNSKVIYFNRLSNFSQEYNDNYESVRNSVNLPSRNDFGFILRTSGGNEIIRAMKSTPSGLNAVAREIPVEVLYRNGTISYAVLNVRIW
ncbi:MAG: hypothetical protein ABIH72_00630 [archaeon]